MSMQQLELASELSSLGVVFRELGTRLDETAKSLENSGRPPSEDTIAKLHSTRKRFVELRDIALQLAAQEKLSPSPGDLASLPDLEKLSRDIAEAIAERERHENIRKMLNQACLVLDRVLTISTKDGSDFTPLKECQRRANEMRAAALEGGPNLNLGDYEPLAAGKHPLHDLLSLVEHRDSLDDQRWEQLEESVTQAFGKSLCRAIARGKLIFKALEPVPSNHAPEPRAEQVAQDEVPLETPLDAENTPDEEPEASPPEFEEYSPSETDSSVEVTLTGPAVKSAMTRSRLTDRTEMDMSLPDMDGKTTLPDTDAETLRRAWPDDIWRRSPLTALQEAELLAPTNGVAVLFGSRIAGLEDVDRFLEAAAIDARLFTLESATDRTSFLHELDALLKSRPDGMILVVVPASCPWSEDWILRSLEHIKRKSSLKKITRVLFVADPESAWTWVRMEEDVRTRLKQEGVTEHSLSPWSNAAVQSWLQDAGLDQTDSYIRERFSRVTGNWGELLHQLGARCKNGPEHWQEHLAEFERELTTDTEWEDRLGLVAQAHAVLKVMAQLTQPVTSEKILSKMGGNARERVETALRWADLLGYVRRVDYHNWSLDPVVRQVVLQNSD